MFFVGRIGAALLFTLLAFSADAQRGTGGAIDSFYFGPTPNLTTYGPVNRKTAGIALRTQTLDPGVRNLVIVAIGQSNMVNIAPSAYAPVNAGAIDNFNPYDGAIYAAADPLIGAGLIATGHPALRLADTLITNGKFDRVVIAPPALGGLSSLELGSGFASVYVPITLQRLAARGIVEGTNVTIIVIWGQGETDGPTGVTQGQYQTNFGNAVTNSRAVGFTGKWFIAEETYNNSQVWPAIQAAQLAVINHGANIWAGPNADLLIGNACSGVACRVADNLHWSNAGSASYAAGWITALAASGAPF